MPWPKKQTVPGTPAQDKLRPKDFQAHLRYPLILSTNSAQGISSFLIVVSTRLSVYAIYKMQIILWKYPTIACNKKSTQSESERVCQNLSTGYASTSSSQHAPHPGLRWQISLPLSPVQLAYWLIGPMISYLYSSLLACIPKYKTVQTSFILLFK